jgi:hypothetical protein
VGVVGLQKSNIRNMLLSTIIDTFRLAFPVKSAIVLGIFYKSNNAITAMGDTKIIKGKHLCVGTTHFLS